MNISTIPATVKGHVAPEIADALRRGSRRLEESFIFDWEERLALAAELADLLAELPEELSNETGRVILALDDEAEDFDLHSTRSDASRRLCQVAAALESSRQEVRVNA